MKMYQLTINGETVVDIEVEAARWLPATPKLNPVWLRRVVAGALADYFSRKPVRRSALLEPAERI